MFWRGWTPKLSEGKEQKSERKGQLRLGRPIAAVSTHTHTCMLRNKSMKKAIGGFEHSAILAVQVLLAPNCQGLADRLLL